MKREAANLQNRDLKDLLQEGVAAAQAGHRARARTLLTHVVEQDERIAVAWLWLSGVVDELEDREICLENVLSIDPDNVHARRGLAQVRQQQKSAATISNDKPESSAVTPRDNFADHQPATKTTPSAIRDDLDDEYQCPYCAALTEHDDRKCQACGGALWVKFRRREKRSTLLWTLLLFQFMNMFQFAAMPVILLVYVMFKIGSGNLSALKILNFPNLLNLYLGAPVDLSPEMANAVFEILPRWAFFLSFLPCLFSFIVFIGLYMRWKVFYYLLLLDAFLGVIAAISSLALGRGLIYFLIGVGLAVLRFGILFRLEDEFILEKRRIFLRVDRGLGSRADFLSKASFYSKRKMWAMAAIHLRSAVGFSPDQLEPQLALAVAYIRLEHYDLAARTLMEARRINPDAPRVGELQSLLDDLKH
mgnify:CR=1 FL=1